MKRMVKGTTGGYEKLILERCGFESHPLLYIWEFSHHTFIFLTFFAMTAPITTDMASTILNQMTQAISAIFSSVANMSGVLILVAGSFIVLGILTSVLKFRR